MESAKDVTRGSAEKVPDWCATLLGQDKHNNGEGGRGGGGRGGLPVPRAYPEALQTAVSSKPRSKFPHSVDQLLKRMTGLLR